MPLTPSHAVAAPIIQRVIRPLGIVLPMSALVIGTMVPDFEYLIRLSPGGGEWHTRVGLLEYCLPAGLATWLIFRIVIGPALLRLLPPGLGAAARATVTPGPTYRLIPGALAAIAIGAASHDLWDSFTHLDGWAARHLPWLEHRFYLAPHHWVRYFLVLQYVSSVLGLLAVMAILWYWVAKQPTAARRIPPGERAWRAREAGLLLLSAIAGAALNASRPHPPGRAWTLGLAAVGSMSALALALLVYGVIDSVRHRRHSLPSNSPCSESSIV
ncbi:MAG TPA: DUF4184 family protein [Gemmatimonadaceae bacterium]|jgi:hypothetical protein